MVVGQPGRKKIIAIIPARGGSKRIPKKNIIDFCGKPMIAWTIEAAIKSNIFDSILVSTDDEQIAQISINHGAEVPFLRNDGYDDFTPISQATSIALSQMEEFKNTDYDVVVQLMANCPLRGSKIICNIYEEFLKQSELSILSCFPYGMFNPWWAHQITDANTAIPIFEDDLRNRRSQDQPQVFCPTGAVWISNTESLKATKTFYSKNYRFFPISYLEAIDIDNYEDLTLGELSYSILNK